MGKHKMWFTCDLNVMFRILIHCVLTKYTTSTHILSIICYILYFCCEICGFLRTVSWKSVTRFHLRLYESNTTNYLALSLHQSGYTKSKYTGL